MLEAIPLLKGGYVERRLKEGAFIHSFNFIRGILMAKVREDQRVRSEVRDENTQMARIIVAEKQESNDRYRFRKKMVRLEDVQDELEAARNGQ